MRKSEPEFVRHLLLQRFDFRRYEFDHASTLRANHVIVVFVIEMVFVIGLVIAKTHLTG